MTTRGNRALTHHLRRVMMRTDRDGLTDGQLLEAFVGRQDAAAFEALLRRHGPMVLGVCRRVLGDVHDVEDAFQATFLVLARKAASVSPRERVGNWLYGVAHTTAVRARAVNAKRRAREKQVADMPEPESVQRDQGEDLHALLDEELARLPEKYRTPVVLCDLEGRPRREVARQLKIPEGTLSSRLTTARRMLARRLTRHGLAVSGGALAAALSPGGASAYMAPSLVNSTTRAAMLSAAGQTATGLISAPVAALTEGVLKAMFLTKLKVVTGLVLVVASVCGAGLAYRTQAAERPWTQRTVKNAGTDRPHAAGEGENPRPDRERIQGTWEVVSAIDDGKKERPEAGRERWTIKDVTVKAVSPATRTTGATTAYMRFRLDTTTTPKRIDLVEGSADDLFDTTAFDKRLEDVAERMEGIYSFRGDTLTVCVSRKKSERPTAFESRKGSDRILLTFRRQSPRKATPAGRREGDNSARSRTRLEGYQAIFVQSLEVMGEYFDQITYANRYEGRIDACSPGSPPHKDVIPEASVSIQTADGGGIHITVRVEKVRYVPGDGRKVIAHDEDLEWTILDRLTSPRRPEGER